jgi:hypothetical protein
METYHELRSTVQTLSYQEVASYQPPGFSSKPSSFRLLLIAEA